MTEIFGVNANTTAVYEWKDLDLRSLVSHNGVLYGITATKLLAFTGSDDGGVDIDAHLKTGKMRFGSSFLKRFVRLYLGGNAVDGLTATVTTEVEGVETAHNYSFAGWVGSLRARRKKLARGIKSRFVQLKVANIDGGDFKLEQCDMDASVITRRIADGG